MKMEEANCIRIYSAIRPQLSEMHWPKYCNIIHTSNAKRHVTSRWNIPNPRHVQYLH